MDRGNLIHSKELPGLMVGGQWRIPKSALTDLKPNEVER